MAKKPKLAARGADRTPKLASGPSTGADNPYFCFEHADRSTPHAWAFSPNAGHAPAVVSKLCDFAKLTWRDIERQQTGGGRKRHRKHHDMPIAKLCAQAQADIKRRKLDERFGGDIFRFRLAGEQRLWGFRDGRVFHVVWWDPEHKVCPSERRHT